MEPTDSDLKYMTENIFFDNNIDAYMYEDFAADEYVITIFKENSLEVFDKIILSMESFRGYSSTKELAKAIARDIKKIYPEMFL